MKVYKSISNRYKLAELDKKYYLIDIDGNFFAWFFPTLVWLFPLKATEVNKKTFDSLIKNEKQHKGMIPLIAIGIIGGRILYESLKNVFEGIEESYSIVSRISYFLLTILALVFVRYMISFINKKMFVRKVLISEFSLSICVEKKTVQNYYIKQSVIRLIMLYLIGLVCTVITIVYSYMSIVVFIIGFFIVTFMNRNCMFPYGSSFYKKDKVL
ncbi:tandem five-TM protein [Enterococcus moraviensis ATCC BAA-383]|uniref:Tandem five-TM protein n=1 Tax=Enterococcus moraviensis ATCC BAA-383 TaxID=1158609 RepID=R2R1J3_9ENTE|nr:DUF443 family protein [Enterococcus moraviensis]EOI02730.1 tandem five-TM protein [Enterococcus moraviensis ATCC BAA-383]EOT73893.1 hypothetical protein I586_00889 [Enterococcus moraviensis ATCC BAA-383]OJG66196.1 tandem five-TM protein [Enterococcus moraviensis]